MNKFFKFIIYVGKILIILSSLYEKERKSSIERIALRLGVSLG